MVKVKKRDGRKKDFNAERIVSAVDKAQKEARGGMTNLGKDVADKVISYIIREHLEEVDIEFIQDLVVKALGEEDREVAKAYENYREERNIKRGENSELIKSIRGLVDCSNEEVLTENSNKQSYLASTQRDLIAGEVSKYIAKTEMIPKHLIEAHNKGIIKIHK